MYLAVFVCYGMSDVVTDDFQGVLWYGMIPMNRAVVLNKTGDAYETKQGNPASADVENQPEYKEQGIKNEKDGEGQSENA